VDVEATQRMDGVPASVSSARHWAAAIAEEWGLHDVVDVLQLVVSEMVANAVMHAGTDCVISLRLAGPTLTVEVSDGSPEIPSLVHDDGAIGGRGLRIVAAVAATWGYERLDEGKRVWAELDTTGGSSALARARPSGATAPGGDGRR